MRGSFGKMLIPQRAHDSFDLVEMRPFGIPVIQTQVPADGCDHVREAIALVKKP
ncbi:hypothetical protein GKA01_12520 [Gluconobacter kanchanaburiensis NBRC 103587]|uniref:Uncharacterized protein n=1 Tax=Gluconobacter kanchanaburiensis NBRC 103587 TaxID=1307948 RepID=A0A511B6G8_9PROT|nr:hypothetical protein GKA01_12520 [Gluconobacter kanchanaburiensis NBRC 103587]